MNGIEQLKSDVREGRVDPSRLVDMIAALSRQLEAAKRRIEELEKKLGGSESTKFSESFSLRSEENRQAAKGGKRRKRKGQTRRGRVTTAEKIKHAERTVAVFPAGVPEKDCRLSHTRPVWRLEGGRAVLVAYEVYRGPNNQYGTIPGVLGRGEFGIEITLAIAYQVYVVGLSFDKVCSLMHFFQNLRLRKSQADALLSRLSRHWADEFEGLCTLLAHSAVVHTDETSWSINSVWAFLSENVRVLFFGVHKDAATLEQILSPATFAGIVVSDDAAVYANFTHSQKCWAHLLRKAIKLTLAEPTITEYRQFLDRLLEIYRTAGRVQRHRRLREATRARKVAELDDSILELCGPVWGAELPKLEGAADEYRLLCNELMRLMLDKQLFTFVTAAPVTSPNGEVALVGGTNNESERTLRSPATARGNGRANKTPAGSRRQTIVVSVLESLRKYLSAFTLATVIEEVTQWLIDGKSCFATLLDKLGLTIPETRILDRLFPRPSG